MKCSPPQYLIFFEAEGLQFKAEAVVLAAQVAADHVIDSEFGADMSRIEVALQIPARSGRRANRELLELPQPARHHVGEADAHQLICLTRDLRLERQHDDGRSQGRRLLLRRARSEIKG